MIKRMAVLSACMFPLLPMFSCKTNMTKDRSQLASVKLGELNLEYDKVRLKVEKLNQVSTEEKVAAYDETFLKGHLEKEEISFPPGTYRFLLAYTKEGKVVAGSDLCTKEEYVKSRTQYLKAGANDVEIYVCKAGDSGHVSPGQATGLDNPFEGAKKWYVNQEWATKAKADGGAAIAKYNTGVWMDRIGAITQEMGLKEHLNAALEQHADLIMIVIYNLPNRDCSAEASNGELKIAANGLSRYKSEYIDKIAEIISQQKYKDLRIVTILEPDSLPNLVTNLAKPDCVQANGPQGYRAGITYALSKFSPIKNVYSYLDIAHSGWLGWDENLNKSVDLISQVIKATPDGVKSLSGFITNTSGYTPIEEPFLKSPSTISHDSLKSATFYENNPRFGELKFAQDMRLAFIAKGFPNTIGMLIDTSRNGWGGPDRPTAASTSNDANTFVNESKIDRRLHRGNWCNQKGGIGERPQASPATGIDAYVWAKPPGESDGISEDGAADPDDPAKKFDQMCSPNGHNVDKTSISSGAIEAPHAGRWNSAHFKILIENAHPPLN